MTIRKLSAMPYAQASVLLFDDGAVALRSYNTVAAYIDSDGWVTCHGLYSMTTRKHLGAFAREYANGTYQMLKALYEGGERYNLHTGEVEKI